MTTATKAAVTDGLVEGFIVSRGASNSMAEFLSRKYEWIQHPQGIECAYVHQLSDLLTKGLQAMEEAQSMYFGAYSPETGFSKAKGLPNLLTGDRTVKNLITAAAKLIEKQAP